MIQAITCTRNREVAFKQCIQYMVNQTLLPDWWVIVSENRYAYDYMHMFGNSIRTVGNNLYCKFGGMNVVVVIRSLLPVEPHHTVNLNMLAGLSMCSMGRDDSLIIFEDDDWYHREYIAKCAKALKTYHVHGQANNIYLNFCDMTIRQFDNRLHSSLASTALCGNLIPLLMAAHSESLYQQINKNGEEFADLLFWQNIHRRFCDIAYLSPETLVIGIKGFGNHAALDRGAQWRPIKDLSLFLPINDSEFYKSLKK